MLPFSLVQKLYDAHFPYTWITWEGKLWEDPENQPNLGELVRGCGKDFGWLHQLQNHYQVSEHCRPRNYRNEDFMWYDTPEEATACFWLSLPKPSQPRTAEHVDVPTEINYQSN